MNEGGSATTSDADICTDQQPLKTERPASDPQSKPIGVGTLGQSPNGLLSEITNHFRTRVDEVRFASICKDTLEIVRRTQPMVGYCPLEEHDGVWLPHTRTTTSHEPVRPNFMEELGEHLKHHRDPSFGAKLLGHLWKLLQRHAWLLKERSPGLCIRPGCLRSARASVQPAKASGHEVRAMATCSESCAKGVIDASWCVTCSGRPMPHTDLEWIDLWLRTRYVVPMRPFSVGFPPGVEIRRKRPNPGPTRVANSDGVQAGGSRWARLSLVQQLFRLLSPLNMFRTYLAALWWGLGLLIAFVLSLWAAVMRRALKRILGHGR